MYVAVPITKVCVSTSQLVYCVCGDVGSDSVCCGTLMPPNTKILSHWLPYESLVGVGVSLCMYV